jgi:A/G-specific adenine glycosylase
MSLPCFGASDIQGPMIKEAEKIKTEVTRKLLAWYAREKRSLPWRETTDPYRIWISEIMLQQTQVDTVIPYYRRFLEAFPTVSDLAGAPLQEVLKLWENMGYYSRARNLHAVARVVVERFGGHLPDTLEGLKSLPGIGEYTAGAIVSMAFGEAVPAVDGNVRRILSRLFAVREPIDQLQTQRRIKQAAAVLVPHKNPGDFNQALMDLGATLCKAKSPRCADCPIAPLCRARELRLQEILPISEKRPPIPHRQGAAAVIRNRDGLLLVVQRPATGLLASLWTFPGGFIKEFDHIENDLKLLVREELKISIRVGRHLASVNHAYTHFRTTLHAYECKLSRGTPQPFACQDWRWVGPAALQALPLSKVDRMISQAIF